MSKDYETEQEKFWAGEFGDEYTERNDSAQQLATMIAVFSKIIGSTLNIKSVLEVGCNRGINLKAIGSIIPDVSIQGIEINKKAADESRKIRNVSIFNGSAFEWPIEEEAFDLSFTRGVLIHIAPERLNDMYNLLYMSSRRYVLMAEYYNPTPVEVAYRGNEGKLFKRDFAGEFMDKYRDVKLLDYGFCYHRDNNYPTDDITWFLMEKMK